MNDAFYMKRALLLAEEAAKDGEVPVGAVIVKNEEIIAEGRNRREKGKNALAHAETEAISKACERLGSWRLHGCEMYVTLEPCSMCSGAIINSRLDRVIFGAYDEKAGACISALNLFDYPLGHKPQIIGGYMEKECAQLLTDFFCTLRKASPKK